ncbi:disulfide bond formation protein B [Myxococcota bacterium]|nr:disulfide bond formation protein B [Myxococcota bacterium]
MSRSLLGEFSYVSTHLVVLVVSCILIAAFGVQFFEDEMPCPLCILQRMAMMLAVVGPVHVIVKSHRHRVIESEWFASAWGMTVLGSVLGCVISTRQILLHIAPGSVGYGNPVLGLHLYTWALLVFVALLLTAGIHLVFIREDVPVVLERARVLSKSVVWLFWLVVLANAISVFFQAGFQMFLPDNPTHYRLLK